MTATTRPLPPHPLHDAVPGSNVAGATTDVDLPQRKKAKKSKAAEPLMHLRTKAPRPELLIRSEVLAGRHDENPAVWSPAAADVS